MSNDMILDMDNFDFSMIDGLVEESAEETTPAPAEVAEPAEDDSALDLLGDDAEEETEEAEEEAEEESEEEESEEEEEAEEAEEQEETEEAEDEEVDYESYEITLPSGESVVLAEVVQGYKDANALKEEREEFENMKNDFVAKSENVGKMLKLAKLEAERVIEDYQDFDWVSLSKEDPAAYADNREFLDRYKERYSEINEAIAEQEKEKEEADKKAFDEKAREAVAVLSRDIPGWGPDLYKSLMDYAVENGADLEEMKRCVDATTFKVLHKAMQFEKGKQTVKAKVKRIGSPKKVVKAQAAKPAVSADAKKTALLKKIEKTGDTSAMFDFLED